MGLGGRRFGTLVTWFLVGGDIYAAYTFIAVPALAYGTGALAFFAVPYAINLGQRACALPESESVAHDQMAGRHERLAVIAVCPRARSRGVGP
jgi:hypothetical protein